MKELFRELGRRRVIQIAIAYAIRHPERVSALILYGTYAQGWAVRCAGEELDTARKMVELVRLGWGQDNPAFRHMFGSLFIPGAEFRTLEGRNHIILEDEPAFEQFKSAVRDFLARHPVQP